MNELNNIHLKGTAPLKMTPPFLLQNMHIFGPERSAISEKLAKNTNDRGRTAPRSLSSKSNSGSKTRHFRRKKYFDDTN